MKVPLIILLFLAATGWADIRICYQSYARCTKECSHDAEQLSECLYGCQISFDSCVKPGGEGREESIDAEIDYFGQEEDSELSVDEQEALFEAIEDQP